MPRNTPSSERSQVVAASEQLETETTSIANGASLTSAIDLSTGRLARIDMPAAWTAAILTFQVCDTLGGTYVDLYDRSGTEYTVAAAASRGVLIPLADFLGVRYIKIRSGTAATPVNQAAARTLLLQVVP